MESERIRDLLAELERSRERETRLLALYESADRALETYRKRVALELHDEIGQTLTSVLLQLKLLQKADSLPYIRDRLDGLHAITREAMDEVRRIARDLRPFVLEKYGLHAAIEAHIAEFTQLTGIQVEFRGEEGASPLPEQAENVLYRVMQEALTNVARHSGADRAVVTLTARGGNALLQVLDYGRGIDAGERQGLGLLGMEERVRLAGGRFWLVNEKGAGVSLNALLPCGEGGQR